MSEAAAAAAPTGADQGAAPSTGQQSALLSDGAGKVSGGANGAAAAVTTGATNDNTGAKGTDWRGMFAEGLDEPMQKQWNSLAQRYQSPAEFAKAQLELRNNALFVPKGDDKPEAWDKVYERLGRPKDPAEYKWNHLPDAPALDEAEQEVRNGFGPVAHRNGLTQRQIDGVIQWHDQQRKVQTDAALARANTTTETHIKTLKAEWGPDFDRNVNAHRIALKHYAGQEFETIASMRLADGTFVGDHPSIVRMMAKIGAERAEDNRFAESFNPSGMADAKAQITKIENEALAKGLTPVHPQWPHAELDKLYARAHPSRSMSPQEQWMR